MVQQVSGLDGGEEHSEQSGGERGGGLYSSRDNEAEGLQEQNRTSHRHVEEENNIERSSLSSMQAPLSDPGMMTVTFRYDGH